MRRVHLVAILCLGVTVAAHADATIKETTNGKGMGIAGIATSTSYIKGNKMRTDVVVGDRTLTNIYDLDAQKMYVLDSKKKEADVWDMAAFADELSKTVDVSTMNASFKPNGQTKQVGGQTADGYDMEVSLRSAMATNQNMTMTVTVQGPVWIVKNSPGTADYARFYQAAIQKGWIFTNPRAAKAQPGQAKAMAELYKQVSASGGIAYETDMQIKLSGEGPMAALLSRMGNIAVSSTVVSVESGALSDDLFAPPADYKLNPRK
jgi:hypothetical protein